jgi:hypothetical protein
VDITKQLKNELKFFCCHLVRDQLLHEPEKLWMELKLFGSPPAAVKNITIILQYIKRRFNKAVKIFPPTAEISALRRGGFIPFSLP